MLCIFVCSGKNLNKGERNVYSGKWSIHSFILFSGVVQMFISKWCLLLAPHGARQALRRLVKNALCRVEYSAIQCQGVLRCFDKLENFIPK